jgi:hypothetical protein
MLSWFCNTDKEYTLFLNKLSWDIKNRVHLVKPLLFYFQHQLHAVQLIFTEKCWGQIYGDIIITCCMAEIPLPRFKTG